jgi:hypothetical protein
VPDSRAGDDLLDSYEVERRAFAVRLVETTDRGFSFVASEGAVAALGGTKRARFIRF